MSNLNIKTGINTSLHCPDTFMYPFKRFSEPMPGERCSPGLEPQWCRRHNGASPAELLSDEGELRSYWLQVVTTPLAECSKTFIQ